MALIHVDFTGYPHTACIHFIASSVDGKCLSQNFLCLLGWMPWPPLSFLHYSRGIRYRPLSSRIPINIGFPLHVTNTSSSRYTFTPSLLKIDNVLASQTLPTIIKFDDHLLNVSAFVAFFFGSCGIIGSLVSCIPWLTSPLATPTRFDELRGIGKLAALLSFSLM